MGMGTSSNILLSLILSVILLSGIASFQPFAFANGEDEKEDEKIKTFESECAKKLDKKNLNLDGLFCLAIFALQQSIADLQNQFDVLFVQKDLDTPVLFLQVDPGSEAPALVVNDGTNDVFTVNKDGSIQIGSSTVVLNPDGTVTGGPLLLEAGSKVDGNLIVAPSPPCNNKDLTQLKGGNWKCSKPADIVASVGILPGSSGITEFVIELGPGMVTAKFPAFEVLQDFKITGLPTSTKEYTIPINLIRLEADMATDFASFEIILEESSDGVDFSQFFFIGTQEPTLGYLTKNNFAVNRDQIIIEAGDTEKFFRLIGRTFDLNPTFPTGSFENLKLVINLLLPEGATVTII